MNEARIYTFWKAPDPSRWPQEGYEHQCKTLAAELLGDTDDRMIWGAGTIIVATLYAGPCKRRVRAHLGCSRRSVEAVSYYLRRAGIWQDDGIFAAEWIDHVTSGENALARTAFTLDAMTGAGIMERKVEKGTALYRIAPFYEAIGVAA